MQELKIVVMGAGAAGKSAMVSQYVQKHFPELHDPTIEDMYPKHTFIDTEPYYLEILDTAGLDQFTAMRELYVRSADAFILVYAIDSLASFEEMPTLLDLISRHGRSPQRNFSGSTKNSQRQSPPPLQKGEMPPVILVGTKVDLPAETRQVPVADGITLATQYGALFTEASSRIPGSVQDVFESLVRAFAAIPKTNTASGAKLSTGTTARYPSQNSGLLESITDSLYCDSIQSPPYSRHSSRLSAKRSMAKLRHSKSVQRLVAAPTTIRQRASQFFRREQKSEPLQHKSSPLQQQILTPEQTPVPSTPELHVPRTRKVRNTLKKLTSEPFLGPDRFRMHSPAEEENIDILGLSARPEIEVVDSKSRCVVM